MQSSVPTRHDASGSGLSGTSQLASRETLRPYLDLVVDQHHSILNCNVDVLAFFCRIHGIHYDIHDIMGARLLALGHLIRGSCFSSLMYTLPGCDAVKTSAPNATQFRTSMLNEALLLGDERSLRHVCRSIGMPPQGDLIRNIDHLLSFIRHRFVILARTTRCDAGPRFTARRNN